MPIDPRSRLGRELDVTEPLTLDARQFDEPVGNIITSTMESEGLTREEAVLKMLSDFAIARQQESAPASPEEPTITLSVSRLYHNDHVETAITNMHRVALRGGRKMSTGLAITRLIVSGAKDYNDNHPDSPIRKPKRSSSRSPLDDLFDDFFGSRR